MTNLGIRSTEPIKVDYVVRTELRDSNAYQVCLCQLTCLQASSVGALTGDFLRAIYLACKGIPPSSICIHTKADYPSGDDGRTEYTIRNSKTFPSFHAGDPHRTTMLKSAKEWIDRFHVYFPSEITVRAAHTHPNLTAGTICFQSSWWARDTFPHHALLDCESERDVLMHNKVRRREIPFNMHMTNKYAAPVCHAQQADSNEKWQITMQWLGIRWQCQSF